MTWQRQNARHAAHFAPHDLTHCTVETTSKGSRGPIPPEAGATETIVGMLDAERASGKYWSPAEVQEFGSEAARQLAQEQITTIRKRRSELFEQWSAIPPGGVLELRF